MNIGRYQPKKLTVLFDAYCPMCVRGAAHLESEPSYIDFEFLPMQSPAVRERFPEALPAVESGNFVVVDDRGGIYRETSARLMCLYATRRYRTLSFKLAHPALRPMVAAVFDSISNNRYRISRILGLTIPEQLPGCRDGRCDVQSKPGEPQ